MNNNQLIYYSSSVDIYWHGLIMGIAVLIAGLVFWTVAERIKKNAAATVKYVLLFGFPLAVVLSRLEYCWFKQNDFPGGMADVLDVRLGGFGLLGAAAAIVLVLTITGAASRRFTTAELFDAAAVAAGPALCVGRLASAFSGEERGFELTIDFFRRMMFTTYSLVENKTFVAVYVYEALAAAVLSIVALWSFAAVYRRARYARGTVALRFAFGLVLTQTLLESWRSDSLFMVYLGFVRINQAVCALIMAVILVTLCVRRTKRTGYAPARLFEWIILFLSFALAFACEFTMTGGTHLRNYCGMIIGLLGMYAVGLRLLLKTRAVSADQSTIAQ